MNSGFLTTIAVAALVAYAPSAHAQNPFTDEAIARGIDFTPDQTYPFGDGLAFCDLDDDGDPDVVLLGRTDGVVGIYENDGTGQFTDRSSNNGLGLVSDTCGVSAGDYDRDGDLDLYITRHNVANVLARNDGNFQFTNVAAAAGVGDTFDSFGSCWSDFDGDGWLDLFVANRQVNEFQMSPNRLYRNRCDGTFQDIAPAFGIDRPEDPTFQGSFFDYDRDGDADLYLATDKGEQCTTTDQRNRLFENVGGAFVDVTAASGTEGCISAMCTAPGDFTGNGYQDMYCTNIQGGNILMVNQGDGTFTREENAAQVGSYSLGWGAVFLDYDNDGWLDLYVCNNFIVNNGRNRLYRHTGAWPCTDVGGAVNVDVQEFSFSCAAADVEGDGDLDLLVSSRNVPVHLFINHEGETRKWARFDVVGEGLDRHAIGANVDVRTGTTNRLREVIAGENYLAQNELICHFGLDAALSMDEVTVVWPGGTTRTLTNLPTCETWTVWPPDKLGDADRDGDRDLADFNALAACFGAPVAPGCEVFDYDGNSSIELADFTAFLTDSGMVQADCNQNGIGDLLDILTGYALDADQDGVPDSCSLFATSCSGDGGDGQGCTDCPCGNEAPPGTIGGCLNSAGTSARLLGSGSASISAADLRFEASGVAPMSSCVLVSGDALAPANAANPCFGLDSGVPSVSYDGLRCVVQSVLRHGVRPSDTNGDVGLTTNAWGTPNGFFGFSAFLSGQTRHFQLVHRDDETAVCLRGQNTSQALSTSFVP